MTYNVNKFWRLTTASAVALTSSLIGISVLGGAAHAQVSNLPAISWSSSVGTKTDKSLSEADVQIKYDGLDVATQLNVTANNGSVSALRSSPLEFSTFWNYGHYIDRAEVRIFDVSASVKSEPLMVLPVGESQHAALADMSALPDDIIYVLSLIHI